jgi:hypothetical protein
MFIRLIIRLFQLIFSAGTVFFSHNKSANSIFQPAYQHSRTAPRFLLWRENKWKTFNAPRHGLALIYIFLHLSNLIYADEL